MYTYYTFQDWEQAADKIDLMCKVIDGYKSSTDFLAALEGNCYAAGDNTEIDRKFILQADFDERRDETGKVIRKKATKKIAGNRISSGIFGRFASQQASFLLGNGVFLGDGLNKEQLGNGFDARLAEMGRKAICNGVCWGYWNIDHIEIIQACTDRNSGFVALLDEITGEPRIGIEFWRINDTRPMGIRLFQEDGVTVFVRNRNAVTVKQEKRAYMLSVASDAAGEVNVRGYNYKALPVVPLYANNEKRSNLTTAIKTKIDLYDRILSDFGDNLDKANDVYWVLNNFGGNTAEALEMLKNINELRVVCNISDGTGNGSTATQAAFEVPYAARQTALELLRKQLHRDYMALDMSELTGGSLTNVAIKAAMTDLNLKADEFEWQCFAFVQAVLRLQGIETEEIKFKRQTLINEQEIVQNIYMMRQDIDRETALKLNPYINQEEIESIMQKVDTEEVGIPAAGELIDE